MGKTRLILAVLALALGYGHFWVATSTIPAGMRWLLHIVGGVLLLAAFGIFVFSYMEIEEAPDGSLRFGAKNPFMRFVLARISEELRPERVTLCNAYWFTVMLIVAYGVITLVATLALSVVAGFIYAIVAMGKGPEMWSNLAEGGPSMVLFFAAVIPWFVAMAVSDRVKQRAPRFLRPLNIGIGIYGFLLICGMAKIVAPPDLTIADVLLCVVGVLAFFAAAAGITVLAYVSVSALQGTRLGQILGKTKERFCPVLAVPTNEKQPLT